MSTEDTKPLQVKKIPLILTRNILIKKSTNRNIKVVKSLPSSLQEDIIYTSKPGDFTSGEVRRMTIVNRLNMSTNSSVTVAKCQSHSGHIFEKTSEEITKLIGQKNYDILFGSLCSVISQELKVRGISAILTVPKVSKENKSVGCQTETNSMSFSVLRNMVDIHCQTPDSWSENIRAPTGQSFPNMQPEKKPVLKKRRNRRPQLAPYVVKDMPEVKQPRRIVISPNIFGKIFKEEDVDKNESPTTESSLPELGSSVFDEESVSSVGRLSSLSVNTTPDLLKNPMNILTNVDKHTRNISDKVNEREIEANERFRDLGSPDDLSPTNEKLPFGMQEALCRTPPEQRIKMLLRQGFKDLEDCLTRDADGHLPIHVAVLTNDVDLLRRQCLVLKMRGVGVDEPADGLTPLRMALFQENTSLTSDLLNFGADVLDCDDEDKTAFHIAAEMATDHLQILINHCQRNARKILQDNEQLWNPMYAFKNDEELLPILMTYINKLYDSQGYTPLMLASKVGKYNNVMTLVESCRATVNLTMPNSGNTALYLAVGAACMDAAERGNKAKIVDHFSKTVEILVENGADPSIDNFAGSSVNDLLTEFNIAELSMLIANKLTSVRFFDGQLPNGVKGSAFMLYKDDHGKVNLKEMRDEKTGKKLVKESPWKSPVKSPKSPVKSPKSPDKSPKSTSVQSSSVQSTSVKSSSVQSTSVKSSSVKSTSVKSSSVQSTSVKSSSVKSSSVKSASVKSSSVQSTSVQSTTVKSPSVQSTTVKSSSLKSPPVKNTPFKTNVTNPTVTKTKSSPIILENVEYKPPGKVNNPSSSDSDKEIIMKPGHFLFHPVKVGPATVKVESGLKKHDINLGHTFAPFVKNFTLGKPIIIKSDVQNNKRKLDIVGESGVSKKPNKDE